MKLVRLRVGGAMLGVLALATLAGPWLTPDATEIVDPSTAGLLPPLTARTVVLLDDGSTLAASRMREDGGEIVLERAGAETRIARSRVVSVDRRWFLLGTDSLGRDVLARTLLGGRVSLAVGLAALLAALVIGVVVGLVAGWRGGAVDAVLMRLVDALLSVPMLFLLVLLAALFRPSLVTLVAVLGLSAWMGVARLVRAQVMSLRERDFVLAARAVGASPTRIALTHLLPNTLSPLAQDAALRLGDLILVEAALSFLGLGVQPPLPSWGNMVAEGEEAMLSASWLVFVPGVAVALTVIAAALVADGFAERGAQPSPGV